MSSQQFKDLISLVRGELGSLRGDLEQLRRLKQQQSEEGALGTFTPDASAQLREIEIKAKRHLLLVKTGQRDVLQIVESTKRQSEDERKELDS